MAGYLLDTNHLSVAVRAGSVRDRIRQAKELGVQIGTCVPALCELEVGIRQVREPEVYRKSLVRLLSSVRVWPLDLETAEIYGEVYHDLRRRGRVLSQVDMMLAALAQKLSLTLLTTDRDFEALPGLPTENWTLP